MLYFVIYEGNSFFFIDLEIGFKCVNVSILSIGVIIVNLKWILISEFYINVKLYEGLNIKRIID